MLNELRYKEYFSIPRVRVLYDDKKNYLGRKLNNLRCCELIGKFFSLRLAKQCGGMIYINTMDEIEVEGVFAE